MSQSFEQLLDAYTMAVRDHQAYVGLSPFGPSDQKIAKDKDARCVEIRAKLVAMFNAPSGEPFDLERARKGDAIEHRGDEVWFVGVMSNGRVVVEVINNGLTTFSPDELRMAPPKMRTVYLNVYTFNDCGEIGYIYSDADFATRASDIRAKRVAFPVQIPE